MSGSTIVGVVSDTHAGDGQELHPSIASLLKGVDLILHAGDLVSLRVIETLRQIAPVESVCGNMDPEEVRRQLPAKRVMTAGNRVIGLIHGWGPPWGIRQRIRGEFGEVAAIVYGHTHQPFAGSEDGVYFFNPGSAKARSLVGRPTIGRLILAERITGEILHL